jgi:FMN phosphatase YigB (HAD superfamily)
MKISAVLFDLDGTLLPMDQDVFIKDYLGRLARKLAPYGYEPKKLIEAVWVGTKAMVQNTGAVTNEEAFWTACDAYLGCEASKDKEIHADFYQNEFNEVKAVCGFEPKAAQIVQSLKEKGTRVVLATNPLFPSIATENRIRWAGLQRSDFEYFTTFENSHYCKPNLDYYREILEKLLLKPEECLMVGNDVGEDMVTEQLGMKTFLLTDCLINKAGVDISQYPNGSFADLQEFLAKL